MPVFRGFWLGGPDPFFSRNIVCAVLDVRKDSLFVFLHDFFFKHILESVFKAVLKPSEGILRQGFHELCAGLSRPYERGVSRSHCQGKVVRLA